MVFALCIINNNSDYVFDGGYGLRYRIPDDANNIYYEVIFESVDNDGLIIKCESHDILRSKITIDGTDYKLDLLFYHRKLKCLVAIDLKLGKFKPQYKGQMELYLKYMQKHDMQPDENPPIGLLLCSEGNTEHIELMMLNEDRIKVAQYLTCLPDKQWFIDKLNRSILIAKEYNNK